MSNNPVSYLSRRGSRSNKTPFDRPTSRRIAAARPRPTVGFAGHADRASGPAAAAVRKTTSNGSTGCVCAAVAVEEKKTAEDKAAEDKAEGDRAAEDKGTEEKATEDEAAEEKATEDEAAEEKTSSSVALSSSGRCNMQNIRYCEFTLPARAALASPSAYRRVALVWSPQPP